ncbi:MAG: FmdB family zinc ribbon protein [Chloroflexota bacterium]|nr:FmdB family zinc ribbon protein [Chloroflexota bacterium]
MPIYEYQCKTCRMKFELKKAFGENGRVECPRCEGDAQRIFSPVPIVFKGSGFYCTDNKTTCSRDTCNSGASKNANHTSKDNNL